MFKKSRVVAIAMLVSVILATTPVMFLVQGQIIAAPAEKLVELAESAGQQVQNLIDMVNANEEAIAQIETVGLTQQFELAS